MPNAKMAALAKDTAIYGISSIVGRFLNYLLVPVHTKYIVPESGGYGIVSNLYAWAGLVLVVLTFGMETTYFRFANREDEDDRLVYGTSLRMVGLVGLAFVALVFAFLKPISAAMTYSSHPEYVACFAVIGALDAFQAIMFSRLRQQHRAVRFMALKMAFIIPNVLLNLAVFMLVPRIPALHDIYVRFDYGVGLIFFVNLICTLFVGLLFMNEMKGLSYGFDRQLARRMLRYAWPLLLLGVVGILNQVFDKMFYLNLVPGQEGKVQLGIYGACAKIALILSLLTQAFRYAYEPFVFGSTKDKDNNEVLAQGMKYFIIFGLLAFLAVMVYLPLLKYLVSNHGYWVGLKVVPIVMVAELFMGIYFNLSFWYKLIDKTWWGAVMSATGAAVMIAINVVFVPRVGYMACAWGGFAGYGVCMLMSWIIGSRYSTVSYPMKEIGMYCLYAAVITACLLVPMKDLASWLYMAIGTLLLLVYVARILKKDLPVTSLPVIGKYFRKK